MASISLTSSSAEEYLCGVFYSGGCQPDYAIYRWNLTGLYGEIDEPETTYFRLPAVDKHLSVSAFASIGSKIYMIGGDYMDSTLCSTDIFVVDTEKLQTNDAAQIVRKIPSVLLSVVPNREAVAVGGKIYTFPANFLRPHEYRPPYDFGRPRPPRPSRFEVFDPETETSKLLPEPDFPQYGVHTYYTVLKSHLLFCTGGRSLFAFDTAHPESGWKDVTGDFIDSSIGLGRNLLPFLPTVWNAETATALGCHDDDGTGLFGTVITDYDHPYLRVAKFGEDPLRIEKLCPIFGIAKGMVGKACFAHGGSVFFTHRGAEVPDRRSIVWEFRKYSLFHHCKSITESYSGSDEYYSGQQILAFQVEQPWTRECLASFVIPGSI